MLWYIPVSGGALRRGGALGHVERVQAVVGARGRRVQRHAPHVVERGVERQPRAHPQVHVRAQVVARRPEVVLVVACNRAPVMLYTSSNASYTSCKLHTRTYLRGAENADRG